jgi:hypothetical protein
MVERWKKLATDEDYAVRLTGPSRVYKPDGKLLAVYLPRAFDPSWLDTFYPTLHDLRKYQTTNRGYASGTESYPRFAGSTRVEAAPVASAIIGSFDKNEGMPICRLTAFNGKEAEKFEGLQPLFKGIANLFEEHVPDRFAAQRDYVQRTHPAWIIRETPFTTITVNNSYPTGYHTDVGDLDEGFSCLTVLRRGEYSGGALVFPEYGVSVDMHNGDQLLMDAHAAHGNMPIICGDCGLPFGPAAGPQPGTSRAAYLHTDTGCSAERISVVSYYRTDFTRCGSPEEEDAKLAAASERKAAQAEERIAAEEASWAAAGAESLAVE